MKKIYVSALMMILFSTVVVSFSYAQASCCAAGSGCCGTSNIVGVQQQPRASSAGPSQAKVGTAKMHAPQINPMPWSVTVNQIGSFQRLIPAATTGPLGVACCPGGNKTGPCCGSDIQSVLAPGLNSSAIGEILACSPFLGTFW